MGEFSLTHILLVGLIFLIFFGPSRLPQLGQSLGKAIRGFKQGLSEIDNDTKDVKENQQVNQQQNAGQIHNQQTQTQQQTDKDKDKQNQNS
jgi:sec-independent protein translocase protein TatA